MAILISVRKVRDVVKKLKRSSVWIAVLFVTLGLAFGANAGVKESPTQFLNAFADHAVGLLKNPDLTVQNRDAAMRRLITTNFDIDYISRVVLARHWRKASAAERTEFSELFKNYIVIAYARRFIRYSGERLDVGKVFTKGTTQAHVDSLIVRPAGRPLKVAWRLRNRGGQWRITDIVVEGVSMALTQRSEFGAFIRQEGGNVSGLNAKLRKMTDQAALPNKVVAEAS
ncbi:MAG: ABC transporter substrate-binding protein [Rhodospirillales bacterium]|nr:ABC transporter substrate-binding protein [Rhodospirillales bacterium]